MDKIIGGLKQLSLKPRYNGRRNRQHAKPVFQHFKLTQEEMLRCDSLVETSTELLDTLHGKTRCNPSEMHLVYKNHLTMVKDFFVNIVKGHVHEIQGDILPIELNEILTWLYVDDTFAGGRNGTWNEQIYVVNRILKLLRQDAVDEEDLVALDAK